MTLAVERARPSLSDSYLRSAAGVAEPALAGALTAGLSLCRAILAVCFLGLLDDFVGFMGFLAPNRQQRSAAGSHFGRNDPFDKRKF